MRARAVEGLAGGSPRERSRRGWGGRWRRDLEGEEERVVACGRWLWDRLNWGGGCEECI